MPKLAATFALLLLSSVAFAEDWPGWRGPRADGTATDTGYPITWSATENVKWKTLIPGSGHSSPVVSKGKVFVTACIETEKKRVLYCVDRASGEILWEQVVLTSDLERKHGENSFASSTPACDGERVYVVDDRLGFASCWDVKTGKEYWKEKLGGATGYHASAVAAEGRVYFTNDAGVTFVVKAEGELDVLAKNAIGEKVYASPAFSDGDIFHRGEKHLWCIGKK